MREAEISATADQRLRDAIEAISEAFVLWDSSNHLVLCNSKYQRLHRSAARSRRGRAPRTPSSPGWDRRRSSPTKSSSPAAKRRRSTGARAPTRRGSSTDAGFRSTSGAPAMAAMSRLAPTSPASNKAKRSCRNPSACCCRRWRNSTNRAVRSRRRRSRWRNSPRVITKRRRRRRPPIAPKPSFSPTWATSCARRSTRSSASPTSCGV